jgi:hypothetical protein
VNRRRGALCLATGVAIALAACAAQRGAAPDPGAVLFDGGIAQFVPLHAGDWFVYRATGGARAEHFERSEVTATANPHELLLTVSDGDTAAVRINLRLEADAVRVVSEMDLRGDIGAVYATPLPLFSVPVRENARAGSAVDLVRISDGGVLDHGSVELTITNARDPANGDIVSRVDRRLVLPGGVLPATHIIWIRPGLGEIATQGDSGERRELVCARIGGRSIGTCPQG